MNEPKALTCPGCGGTIAPPLGSRRTVCEFCKKPFFYAGEDFLPRYAIAPRLGEKEVQARCHKVFSSRWAPPGLPSHALLLKKHRSYLPFYLLTGKRGGVMVAKLERVDRSGNIERLGVSEGGPSSMVVRYGEGRLEPVLEEDSRVVLGDFRYIYPAAVLENLDIDDVDLAGPLSEYLRDAEPARLEKLSGEGEVVDVDLPLERIIEKGVASTQGNGELEILEIQAALVYIPILTLTFRYGSQVFNLIMEELAGTWMEGHMPFRRDIAFFLGVGVMVLLGTSLGRLAGLLVALQLEEIRQPGSAAGLQFLLPIACVSGPLLAAVAFLGLSAAWGLVRAPYRVRLTPKGEIVEAAGPVPQSPLKPVNTFLVWLLETFVESQAGRRGRWDR